MSHHGLLLECWNVEWFFHGCMVLFTYALNFRMTRRTENVCAYWLGSNIAAWQAVFEALAGSMVFAIDANQKVAFGGRLGAIGNKRLNQQNQTLNSSSTWWNTFNCAVQQRVEFTQVALWCCWCLMWAKPLVHNVLEVGVWLPVEQQLDQPVVEILGPWCSYTSTKNWAWEQNTMVINLQWFFNLQWSSIWIQILSAPGDTSVVVHPGMNFSSVSSIGPSGERMVGWPCGWLVPEPKKC